MLKSIINDNAKIQAELIFVSFFQHCSEALRSGCDGDSLWAGVLDNSKMGTLATLVKNDRLLTDSLPMAGETPVKHEHSYSLETRGMASDGDSIPDSPLSLNDGKQIKIDS